MRFMSRAPLRLIVRGTIADFPYENLAPIPDERGYLRPPATIVSGRLMRCTDLTADHAVLRCDHAISE